MIQNFVRNDDVTRRLNLISPKLFRPGETVLGRLYPTKWDDLHIPRKQLIVKVDEKLRTVEVKRVCFF